MDIDSYVMNTSDHHTFRLTNTKVIHRSGVSPETAYSPPVHSELGVETSEAAVAVLVGPHGVSSVDIEFMPRTQKTVTSLLILRSACLSCLVWKSVRHSAFLLLGIT